MAGGVVKENLTVSFETSYVVIGAKGASSWKDGTCPQASEAEKRQEEGQNISVVSEETLFSALEKEGVTKEGWAVKYKERLSNAFDKIEKTISAINWTLDSSTNTLYIDGTTLPDLLGILEDAKIAGFQIPVPTEEERRLSWEQSTETIINDDGDGDVRAAEYGPEDLVTILPWGSRINELKHIFAPILIEIPPAFFAWSANLEDAVLPSVRIIRNGAFYECTSLRSVYMPEAVFIGSGSFCQCRALKCKLVLSHLEALGSSAFTNCKELPSFSTTSAGRKRADGKEIQGTGYTIKSIGNYAFVNCEKLKSVGFSKDDTLLGKECFHRCKSLPDNIRALGDEKFAEKLAEHKPKER